MTQLPQSRSLSFSAPFRRSDYLSRWLESVAGHFSQTFPSKNMPLEDGFAFLLAEGSRFL